MPLVSTHPDVQKTVQRIALRVEKFSSYRNQMTELATDFNKNQPGFIIAQEKMGAHATAILGSLSQMIVSEDAGSSPERAKVLLELSNLRQVWMNLLIAKRAFMAMRGKSEISNLTLYATGFQEAVVKFEEKVGSLLNFEQESAIEEIKIALEPYMAAMKELIVVHSSDKWRTDSYLMRTEISPLVRNIKKDIKTLVESKQKAVEKESQSN